MPRTSPALEQKPPAPAFERDDARAVLIVDMGSTIEEVTRRTFTKGVFRTPSIAVAVRKAVSGRFDIILCDEASAFGERGFTRALARENPELARHVIVVIDRAVPGSPRMQSIENRYIVKPVSPYSLLHPPERRPEFSIPSPAIRRPARPKDRVLVIDEHAARPRGPSLRDHGRALMRGRRSISSIESGRSSLAAWR